MPAATVAANRNLWFHSGDLGRRDDDGYFAAPLELRFDSACDISYPLDVAERSAAEFLNDARHALLKPMAETPREDLPEKPAADPSLVIVKSPIVGTFYEGPSPGAAPFVAVGERVQPGKVLCIIESMKLMNEIEAEHSGIIESRLVLNGQPVEYGEALFAIRTI